MTQAHKDVVRLQVDGVTVLVLRDNTFPVVHFTLALRYGALSDPPQARGLLALLLPLMLRGTKTKSRATFNEQLDALGSSVDAMVGQETAYLRGTALTAKLAPTLELLGEALSAPALDAKEFALLRDEALQELISERDDDDALAELFLRRALYATHPLGEPPHGSVASLRRLDIATVRRAYDMIGKEHFIVGLVGDIDGDTAAGLVHKLMQPLPSRPQLPEDIASPRYPSARSIWVIDKPERTQVQLRVATGGVGPKHGDLDAFWLGMVAFGGTFTSPLTHQVRDLRGWSYFASAEFRRRARYPAPVILRTAPALRDAVDCLKLKLELLEELSHGVLDQACLTLARDYLLGRVPLQTATAFDLAGPAILLELLGLPLEQLWDLPERLSRLDIGRVPLIVGKHLSSFSPVAVLVAPAVEVVDALGEALPDVPVHVVAFTEGLPKDVADGIR